MHATLLGLLVSLAMAAATTEFESMYLSQFTFNEPVTTLDTSRATTMYRMFYRARAFNQPIDHFVTTNVRTFDIMFFEAYAFNQPIGGWDTSNATTMFRMFDKATAFAQELHTWDVGAVTNFVRMFDNSRMQSEAVADGPGFARACRIHHAWKRNAYWNPVDARLVTNEIKLDLSLCAPTWVPYTHGHPFRRPRRPRPRHPRHHPHCPHRPHRHRRPRWHPPMNAASQIVSTAR